jgi:DNA-binding MarR family transcriptional regulator
MSQFRTLARVDQQPSASLSALAEHLGASLPTTSRIVGGLVDKGFLRRGDCREDRRQLALLITPRGRAVLDEAWSSTRRQMEAEIGKLTAQQRATLAEAMGIFRSLFGAVGLPERIGNGRAAEQTVAAAKNGRRARGRGAAMTAQRAPGD